MMNDYRSASSDKNHGCITVGVIGCGYWGPNLVRNFSKLPDCHLKSICDTSRDRRTHMESLYPGINTVSDANQIINDPEIDAVVIAVPVHLHYLFAHASLRAGKHVLVEKPMASSSAECGELIRMAEDKRLTLMVGHTFIYSESVLKISQIVKSGGIGDVLYINSQRLNLGLFQKKINVAWDLAPHDLSIILHILGEFPASVNCQGNAHITPGVEDVTNISLSFRSGRFATIQSSWIEPRKVRQMTIVGTKGMIVFDDVQPNEKIRIYDVRITAPPHYDTFGEFQYSYHYGDSSIPHLKHTEPLKIQCQHFLDCINKKESPVTDGSSGLDVVQILEASSISLEKGGSSVDLQGRVMPQAAKFGGSRLSEPGSAAAGKKDEAAAPSLQQP